jgi:hypothetical protein
MNVYICVTVKTFAFSERWNFSREPSSKYFYLSTNKNIHYFYTNMAPCSQKTRVIKPNIILRICASRWKEELKALCSWELGFEGSG